MVPAGKIWNLTLPPVIESTCLEKPWANCSRCTPPGHEVAVRMLCWASAEPTARASAAAATAAVASLDAVMGPPSIVSFAIRGRNATRRRQRECSLRKAMTRKKTDSGRRHLPAIRRMLVAHPHAARIGVEATLLDKGAARGEAAADGQVHQRRRLAFDRG